MHDVAVLDREVTEVESFAIPRSSADTTDVAVVEAPVAKIDGVDADLLSPEDQEALLAQLSPEELARFYLSNETEGKRAYQRSLDLFEEGVAIVDVKEELLLKKVSERVKFINPPKLLQRQLHNVLLFVARPNMSTQEVFSVSLDYLSWAVEHTVNGFGYLRDSLTEMQQSLMQVNYQGVWHQTQLIHDVAIQDNVLYYKLPSLVRRLYAVPERYYHVSMRMNARFRSKYAHAMYELLVENQWRKQTTFMTVQEFRERMGIAEDEYKEYKRLAARVLTPALKELEELGDYYATVKYKHEARKVVGLNFIIHENPKNVLQFEDANLDPECFATLREEFGLNPKQITELTRNFEVKRIHEITDVLFYRYICRKKAVRNGFRLVQNALADTEDKYFLTNTEKAELALIKERRKQAAQEQEFEKSRAATQQSLTERFEAWWAALSEEEKQTAWDQYLSEPESAAARQARKVKRGSVPDLSNVLARAGMLNFAARTGQLPDRVPEKLAEPLPGKAQLETGAKAPRAAAQQGKLAV
jgi:hypothetical protein